MSMIKLTITFYTGATRRAATTSTSRRSSIRRRRSSKHVCTYSSHYITSSSLTIYYIKTLIHLQTATTPPRSTHAQSEMLFMLPPHTRFTRVCVCVCGGLLAFLSIVFGVVSGCIGGGWRRYRLKYIVYNRYIYVSSMLDSLASSDFACVDSGGNCEFIVYDSQQRQSYRFIRMECAQRLRRRRLRVCVTQANVHHVFSWPDGRWTKHKIELTHSTGVNVRTNFSKIRAYVRVFVL